MIALLMLALMTTAHPHRPAPHKAADTTRQCGDALTYQVMLDRAGFSPGEIDGATGPNLTRAVRAFQASAKLPVSGRFDCATLDALRGAGGPSETLVNYTITAEDASGPFLESALPNDLASQATLPSLSYGSLLERLAEQFHASPRLLTRINSNVRFAEGAVIRVPNVEPFDASRKPTSPAPGEVTVEVSRSDSTLRVVNSDCRAIMFAPVSSGSEHDPLPIGEWKVTGTAWLPPFHYNPTLFWDAEPGDEKATIKPGPNNPVGVVWIDINVPHYGMHGTPSPNLVGHAQSHGCVRLTNWDAARLASLVKPGTRVAFVK